MGPRIEDIPLAKFDLSLAEMRIINMPRILQVEKSMRLHGQLQPVVARADKGVYQIIDGFKRSYTQARYGSKQPGQAYRLQPFVGKPPVGPYR